MGATNYTTVARGKNAKEAFESAVANAQWEHGHGGYTGTIAEKGSFVEFPRPKGVRLTTVKKVVYGMTWDDKWGPSACMELKPKTYIFFGLASY